MTGYPWLTVTLVCQVQHKLVWDNGGTHGVRDWGALEGALNRPAQHEAYGENDPHTLAAILAESLIRNHPFVDCNKRTAYACLGMFLAHHGYRLEADGDDAVDRIVALTDGSLTKDELADWLREKTVE